MSKTSGRKALAPEMEGGLVQVGERCPDPLPPVAGFGSVVAVPSAIASLKYFMLRRKFIFQRTKTCCASSRTFS